MTDAMQDYLDFFLRSEPNGPPVAPLDITTGGEESGQNQFETPQDTFEDIIEDTEQGFTDPLADPSPDSIPDTTPDPMDDGGYDDPGYGTTF